MRRVKQKKKWAWGQDLDATCPECRIEQEVVLSEVQYKHHPGIIMHTCEHCGQRMVVSFEWKCIPDIQKTETL